MSKRKSDKPICIATTKKGTPCPVRAWGSSQFCIGHDPGVTNETRAAWRLASAKTPHFTSPNYRYMTPQEIIHYVSCKMEMLEEKYGQNLEALPVIADFLRVAIQANRLLQSRHELALQKKSTEGPRTVRLVRDEVDPPSAADVG